MIDIINNVVMWVSIVIIVKIIFSYLSLRRECDLSFEKFKYKLDNFEDILDEDIIDEREKIHYNSFDIMPYYKNISTITTTETKEKTE